jgi:hypothetical protein
MGAVLLLVLLPLLPAVGVALYSMDAGSLASAAASGGFVALATGVLASVLYLARRWDA